MEWTKCSDQLPKQGIYIVWSNEGMWRSTQAVFIPEMGWIGSRGEAVHVTHWIQYPESPEGAPQNPPKKMKTNGQM